ncbi:hypothetical protein F9C07_1138 [Aspergillus flavus]|uniref:Uncharacterized protein n=6 Tax=Aspergillus subgen. Circumdati TaxID=2720871 RepID=B8MZ69_ASPFN|nr:unnamed protein product [Aspergillus oryzae RIB40]XP_041140821.1 uncharacterized protein G4B84_001063 [Aspergillus flavus NRRL3357]EIT79909.1 hypothetical protein Ao3042_03680 [Aspergillus oryzae 3.042]KAB8249055.1 hypothetical protein BDV35DRAFT_145950 [Aspergillus flavus]KDE81739.1 hypothetical protein AO1008_07925 [Aspergillus oryzae 100-8]KJJ33686.1 hypothetical protein AFLA70_843g000170 [Aspergillus flavus AF70]OOO12698.1 Orotidine 5'-phosphate decarboxylase [Aspergillus oryzae]GMG49|eukprot:EIT79909.1 hypothetical protein Ao3042_03680 [Aspergillus oryzae 3.042]
MEGSTFESPSFLGNRLISYLQTLATAKKGLPFGLPVCVAPSHTITTTDALLQLASSVGPHIAILQIHADIIDDWSDETARQLTSLAKKHGFLLWESGRILNATVDIVGRQKTESREMKNQLVDLIRKKYTKGVIKEASWAVLGTAWASGVAVGNQEADILIPTLKAAAREAVADAVQTIKTEITANNPSERPSTGHESITFGDNDATSHLSEYAVGDTSGLGLPPRKASTISLTQTITQHTEDVIESPTDSGLYERKESFQSATSSLFVINEDIPPPPLLARGLVLCLPSNTDSSFKSDYRKSCLAAARANQDFVIGFICGELWHLVSQRNDIFDTESLAHEEDQQQPSPYASDEEEPQPCLALFSHVFPRLNLIGNTDLDDHDDENGVDEMSSSAMEASQADIANLPSMKLFYSMAHALKLREASIKGKQNGHTSTSIRNEYDILHIPVVSLP